MSSSTTSDIESELYYLVAKYLECGPCRQSAVLLRQEIEENSLLPKRHDWTGGQHNNTFADFDRQNSHISANHLLKIVERINTLLARVSPPSVTGVASLLGDGRQSLLRDVNSCGTDCRNISSLRLSSFRNGAQLMPSVHLMSGHPFNATLSLISRENSGPLSRRQLLPTKCYDRYIRYRRLLGHLSSVYCVSFDRTGRYIFTGADDSLVKIWSATDGRLLSTLRGHINEITDLTINCENTLIAAGSCDKMIRVWCLKTTAPITVLSGHTGAITSVKFCPLVRDDIRYLVSTANDGCVCFWRYNSATNDFHSRPLKFTERHKPCSQLVCSSFSSGGVFLAIGSTDNYLRVYHITAPAGPTKILEIEQHSDHVDSIQFSNLSTRFVSGSRDGIAHIWYFNRQHWHNIPLKMSERLPGSPPISEDVSRKLRVSMVCWTCDDVHVITSLSDHSIKVWFSQTGQLKHVLYGHEDEVFVIESHPKDSRLFLSGGHEGAIILWDVLTGEAIKQFHNSIDGQGHGAVFDCKFSPDGLMFASTDSHGHLSLFGMMSSQPYSKVPDQVFFHTDYRPVIRDTNQYAIDEQTQCAPHLMPPPFLVDIDGNPYPPIYQRLVPGRANCSDSQLVPYVAVHNANGNDIAEVLAPVELPSGPQPSVATSPHSSRPTIDDMIQRLEREQRRLNHEHDYTAQRPTGYDRREAHSQSSPRARHGSSSQRTAGSRRAGSVEGVRQPANFMSRDRELNLMVPVWAKKMVVKPLTPSETLKAKSRSISTAESEEMFFNKERKKRPKKEDSSVSLELAIKEELFTRRKRRIIQQRRGVRQSDHRQRSSRRSHTRHSGITDYENPEDLSDESDSDYTGDKEWADTSSHSESEESEESSEVSEQDRNKKKRLKNDCDYRPQSWKQNCLELLNYILEREDSTPFRSPVDQIQYPDYSQVIDTPMDLTTVKEQLLSDLYETPNEFCKDMRLVFLNSKAYNTNKKSRIYSMTVRLSNLFEEKIRRIRSDWRSDSKYESDLKRGIKSRRRKPIPMSPIRRSSRSPSKRSKRSRRMHSTSSPTFDLSLPSTSGYSSRSKSSQSQSHSNARRRLNTKTSPKKTSLEKVTKNCRNNNKLNFKSLRRSAVSSVPVFKNNKNVTNGRTVKKKVISVVSSFGRKIKRVIKDSDEDNESHDFNSRLTEDETIDGDIVKHFDSDTEIEDDRNDPKGGQDSDATEIEDPFEGRPKTSSLRCRRTAFSEHTYSLPPRRTSKMSSVISRRARLKASEESESTQSSSAHSNHSNHSNYSNESHSAITSMSHTVSEVSDQSYLSDSSIKLNSRRSKRKRRQMDDKWRTSYESEDDLRRLSLGLRNKRRSNSSRFDIDSPIRTRSQKSGKKRVRYNFEEEEVDNDNQTIN